jgi:hypothetical protein
MISQQAALDSPQALAPDRPVHDSGQEPDAWAALRRLGKRPYSASLDFHGAESP